MILTKDFTRMLDDNCVIHYTDEDGCMHIKCAPQLEDVEVTFYEDHLYRVSVRGRVWKSYPIHNATKAEIVNNILSIHTKDEAIGIPL